jgi:hypothetical protein
MEIEELQDFVDWDIKRNGDSKKLETVKMDEEIFANIILNACVLARRQKIDIVDALTKKIEIIRGRK